MAKIIRKGNQLEEEYYAIEQERTEKNAQAMRLFGKITLVSIIVYGVAVAFGILADMLSIIFIPLTVCFGFILIIVLCICSTGGVSGNKNTDILISGMTGERIAAEVLATLPDDYVVFQDVVVTYDGKSNEIDNIVVGRSGVFIVEVKNHNGNIIGDCKDTYWTQYKVGRGGTPYTKEMYNPTKQVGSHIYRLANYLRKNGMNTYIEGMVYFTNANCVVEITGNSNVSVYSRFASEEELLCRQILTGSHNLDLRSINQICRLISQL